MTRNIFYEAFHDRENTLTVFTSDNARTGAHFHRGVEMLYITDGNVHCAVDDTSFDAQKDDIVFVHPCGVHELTPSEKYSDYVLIAGQRFTADFAATLQKQSLPPLLDDREFNKTLLPIIQTLNDNQALSDLTKRGYIDVVFGMLLSHYPLIPALPMPQISLMADVLNYIDDHFSERLSLDALADTFGYNKYYFSRLFNAHIGENFNQYINRVRIRNVISRAKRSDKPDLSEIVFDSGFESMTTFYRNFKKYYDRPPTKVFTQ